MQRCSKQASRFAIEMKEYGVVKVVSLLSSGRHYDGTEGVKRSPRIGDVGTIVHVNAPNESYVVECVNSDGYTVWLADFNHNELEPALEV